MSFEARQTRLWRQFPPVTLRCLKMLRLTHHLRATGSSPPKKAKQAAESTQKSQAPESITAGGRCDCPLYGISCVDSAIQVLNSRQSKHTHWRQLPPMALLQHPAIESFKERDYFTAASPEGASKMSRWSPWSCAGHPCGYHRAPALLWRWAWPPSIRARSKLRFG